MYARSLPTIAQVSPDARFRGKRPVWRPMDPGQVIDLLDRLATAGVPARDGRWRRSRAARMLATVNREGRWR
jgi:hypothetical protein